MYAVTPLELSATITLVPGLTTRSPQVVPVQFGFPNQIDHAKSVLVLLGW